MYLPGIVTKLSTALGGMLNGFSGLLAGLMPTIDRFASYLENLGTRFSEWANSAKGQNEIKEFAERATESFLALWGAVKEFSGFLKDVLFNPATLAAGNGMFDSMRQSFAGFREDIQNGNLEEWLRNGMEFGSALKDVISALAESFRVLSDSGTLDVMAAGMRGLAGAIEMVNTALPYMYDVFVDLLNLIPVAGPLLSAAAGALGKLVGSSEGSEGALKDWNVAAEAASTKAAAAKREIDGLSRSYDILGGSASEANRRMAYQKLGEQEGVFSAASKVGVGRGDLVSASLGDPKAIKRVKDALAEVDMTNLDVAYSANLVATAMGLTKDQFSKVRSEAIEAAIATGNWKEQFPGIPKDVLTKFKTEGVPEGRRQLQGLIGDLDLTKKERTAVFELLGIPEARKEAKGLSTDISKYNPKMEVGADTKPAETESNSAKSFISRMKAKMKVDADASPATSASKSAKNQIDRYAPLMKVGAKTAEAIGSSQSARGLIDRMKASLGVGANTSSAMSAAVSVTAGINQLKATISIGAKAVGSLAQKALSNIGLANGGVVSYYANGGVAENHVAQIAQRGVTRIWNEPETQGEAYIPLAASKRKRSLSIWKETGRRLGAKTLAYANGDVVGGDDKKKGLSTKAIAQLVHSLAKTINGLSKISGVKEARSSLTSAMKALKEAGKNNAAVRQQIKNIAAQRKVDDKRVGRLLKGLKAQNATIADYAKAREYVAAKLAKANEKLNEAIALRDSFKSATIDSLRSYAGLTTASAKVVDNVEQALTANDITSNLRDRLAAIRKFQSNLNALRALGLGEEGYKQLIEAGVEQGGAFAEALLAGGIGSVDEVNALLKEIGISTAKFGGEASTNLYQAGVDSAKGVVDGLKSMDAALEAAGERVGNTILRGIRKALGLKPGKKGGKGKIDAGEVVSGQSGPGPKGGGPKKGGGLSSRVATSPLAAQWGRPSPVSGNSGGGPVFRDLIVNTPTENPQAVAAEVLNEMVGRL